MIQNNTKTSLNIGDELGKTLTIHKNVKQDIIITTEDKIKLVLISTKESLASRRDWWTPFGLFITSITTLCTSDFKEVFGIKKDFWDAFYILMIIISCIWLIISLIKLCKNWNEVDIEKIIGKIKLNDGNMAASKDVEI